MGDNEGSCSCGGKGKYYGKYRGKVIDNIDPLLLGRIIADVPAVPGSLLNFAQPCAPYAGMQVGFYAIPPIGANVWIEFEGGDPTFPIWSGCFWGEGEVPLEAPPETKVFKTEFITMILNDLPEVGGFTLECIPPAVNVPLTMVFDAEGITVTCPESVINMTEESITITVPESNIEITPENITVDVPPAAVSMTAEVIEVEAPDINVTAEGAVEVEAPDVNVTGDVSIEGAVEIVGDTNMTGAVEVEGETNILGALTVEGENNVAGALTIEGETNIAGALTIEGDEAVAGVIEGVVVPPVL